MADCCLAKGVCLLQVEKNDLTDQFSEWGSSERELATQRCERGGGDGSVSLISHRKHREMYIICGRISKEMFGLERRPNGEVIHFGGAGLLFMPIVHIGFDHHVVIVGIGPILCL